MSENIILIISNTSGTRHESAQNEDKRLWGLVLTERKENQERETVQREGLDQVTGYFYAKIMINTKKIHPPETW